MKRLRGDGDGNCDDSPPNKQLDSSSGQVIITSYAKKYLKKVKAAFEEQNQDFGLFRNIMRDYKEKKIDVVELIGRVNDLLGRKDLVVGFNEFLPEEYEINFDDDDKEQTKESVVKIQEAIDFLNRFQGDEKVYEVFLDLLNSYRKGYKIVDFKNEIIDLFYDHQDLLEELNGFISGYEARTSKHHVSYDRESFQPCNEQRISVTSNDDCDVGADCRDKKEKRRGNKVNRERTNCDEEDDINGKLPRTVDYNSQLNKLYNQGLRLCEIVKECNGSDDYMALLKCLHCYSTRKVEMASLRNMVSSLLGDSDVMDEFDDYLKHCEDTGGFLAGSVSEKLLRSGGYLSRSVNVEDGDEDHNHETERAKEKDRYKENDMTKSIQELDLSKCKKGTRSYRLLPEDYRIASAGQRSELGAQVLNDRWVCLGSRYEDYCSKDEQMNQYEEILFRCEGDKFELDMLFHSVKSARKSVKKLWEKIKNVETTLEEPIHIEDHLTILNLRCIERLYGEYGLDVLDKLHKNPEVVLHVILNRLKQKRKELKQRRLEFDKIWAQTFVENHQKSLDKKQNSRSLSAKPSETEIKETKE